MNIGFNTDAHALVTEGGEVEEAESALPEELWIGPYLYEIQEEPRLKEEGDFARVRLTEAVIEVATPMHPTVQRVHLLHEVIHVILRNAGFVEHDERFIDTVAHGIIALDMDNPGFFGGQS